MTLTCHGYKLLADEGKGKGNVDLYSISSRTPLMCSDMYHTVLPANNTIFAFTRKHSPGATTMHICTANAWVQLTTHLSTPRRWIAELADIQWTVYPEEVTRQLHVMSQARGSSPVIDRRSNHCAMPPTYSKYTNHRWLAQCWINYLYINYFTTLCWPDQTLSCCMYRMNK